MQDSASFWTDIKNLETQLSEAPDSFCFAGLSAVYLKAGLTDDALHVARVGVAKHPEYLAGQRALALACHAKGINDEALAALQQIVLALPEDIPSQKLLGRLLVDAGELDYAVQVYRTALEFAPEEMECRLQLESLQQSTSVAETAFEYNVSDEELVDDEEIIEDIEMLEELEVLYEDESPETESLFPVSDHDPLSTGTLAELYVTQGFIKKAIEIYRAILLENPADRSIGLRITELESLDAADDPCATSDEICEDDDTPFFTESTAELSPASAPIAVVPSRGKADNARATLDGWLENIRRIKACR